MKIFLCFIFFFNLTVSSNAFIKSHEIEYSVKNVAMKGYLVYDDSTPEKRPGVLVVHEWWGHNEHARTRARMLAAMGYTALAIDMYGNGKTADHPKKANELMTASFKNWDLSKARFEKAVETIKKHKTVNSNQIAAIGYCFGGEVSLRIARSGVKLNGVAAFHSALPLQPAMTKGDVKAAILVANGSDDSFIKPKTVARFTSEMFSVDADMTYINLQGIKHSYTNPQANEFSKIFNIPNLAYDRTADRRTWIALERFLERIFAKN